MLNVQLFSLSMMTAQWGALGDEAPSPPCNLKEYKRLYVLI